MNYSESVSKNEILWLAERFGYNTGFFGNFKYNEDTAFHIIKSWARLFEVDHLIEDMYFFKSNIQINSSSELMHAMILRTILRPSRSLPRRISDKPIEEPYNTILDREYPNDSK